MFLLKYLIWLLPLTTGATWYTLGTLSSMAFTSPSFSLCDVSDITPRKPRCAGWTINRFVPMEAIRSITCFWAPAPNANMDMTDPTPMIIPNIAKNVLSLFAERLFNATLMIVQNSIRSFTSFLAYDFSVPYIDLPFTMIRYFRVMRNNNEGASFGI